MYRSIQNERICQACRLEVEVDVAEAVEDSIVEVMEEEAMEAGMEDMHREEGTEVDIGDGELQGGDMLRTRSCGRGDIVVT